MAIKIVRNNTNHEQWVIADGARHTIPPRATMPVEDEIADLLVRKCKPAVVFEDGLNTVHDTSWTGPRQWLYNATGNPDLPETVEVHVRATKRTPEHTETRENPMTVGAVMSYEYDGGQIPGKDADGQDTLLNMPTVRAEIWPWTRRSFPKPTADTWLHRDSMHEKKEHRGKVRRAKEPTSFEPDNLWSYDDLRVYAEIIDTKMDKGPTLVELKDGFDMASAKERSFEEVLENAKHLLLRRLFFRVADEKYVLPTREEFYEYKGEPSPSYVDLSTNEDLQAEVARLRAEKESLEAGYLNQRRGRGRPPGSKNKPKADKEEATEPAPEATT